MTEVSPVMAQVLTGHHGGAMIITEIPHIVMDIPHIVTDINLIPADIVATIGQALGLGSSREQKAGRDQNRSKLGVHNGSVLIVSRNYVHK